MASKLERLEDIAEARKFYEGRIFTADKINQLMQNPDRPHVFYKISNPSFVLFDAFNFPDNPQQQYQP